MTYKFLSNEFGFYSGSIGNHLRDLKREQRGAWLAQAVEHTTLDLMVVSLSSTLGVEIA